MAPCYNEHLLADDAARAALRDLVRGCEAFALAMPDDEPAQAAGLKEIIEQAGRQVRANALRLGSVTSETEPVIRLYKAPAGSGRLKLQLFPLGRGDSHPPHAHYNLISCQIVLTGRARIREYSLLRRLDGGNLEIREEPQRLLEPGDGVYTLQRRNNIHWQEGLVEGTVLLNINWQGFFADTPMAGDRAINGRCYIDWDRTRPGDRAGEFIVPEVVTADG